MKEDTKRVVVVYEDSEKRLVSDKAGDVYVAKPLTDGRALAPSETIIKFSQVPDRPGHLDMHTVYETPGPAKVSNDRYREGWDAIFNSEKNTERKELN